ncbi:putative tRNA pseudouridine synthase Pus10 [Clonorchis sinensis]|uniref:tRNA pseudouridine(55) synthase n=1 Tax=Clonorchis sinensis TaxID=79923 RepID=A0A3R7C217_CLOSI|nr:putative tRNA pseudouridine synthase Pus10 [Clonorchis sinensis]
MTLVASESGASVVLRELGCCSRCVVRLLHGAESNCQTDVLNAADGVQEKPICPACCGLLHHPSLCQLTLNRVDVPPTNQLLETVAYKIQSSTFEYSACILKTVTPVNVILREHILWALLLQKASEIDAGSSGLIAHQPEAVARFSTQDVDKWRRTSISLKVAWQWIVEPLLSSALQVPFIQSPKDILKGELSQSLGFPPFPETSVLTVNVELTNEHAKLECEDHLRVIRPAVSSEIQAHIDDLLNCRPAKNRRKRRALQKHVLDENTEIQEMEISPCQFSKTNLQPLLWTILDRKFLLPCNLPATITLPTTSKVQLGRDCPVVIAGRYVKLDRYLPQTPWIIGTKRKLSSSVEELIADTVREQFGRNTNITFSSSGREDVDVRCLGLGRPFILQIENYDTSLKKVIENFSKFSAKSHTPLENDSSVDLLLMATLVNSRTGGRLFVRDLQVVNPTDAARAIKHGELEKSKCYRAVCWCGAGGLTTDLVQSLARQCRQLNSDSLPPESTLHTYSWPPAAFEGPIGYLDYGPITICQPTPIRVLHRRAALERMRDVHLLRLADYRALMKVAAPEYADYEQWSSLYPAEELFVLELRCDAGTYVKEFVHGDLGRSRPSLASLLGRPVDILTLDVVAVELNWPTRLPDPDLPTDSPC